MRAPLRNAAVARRSCAWTEAARNSGEPGFGSRFLSSARRARFRSSREGMGRKSESRLQKPAPSENPRLGRVSSIGGALRYGRWDPCSPVSGFPGGRAGRGGGLHTTEMSGPLDTAIGHEVSHPSRSPGRGSFEALLYSSSDRSLRRAQGAVNATLRPPVSTRRVIDMVALLLVVPAANSTP